MKRGRSVWGAVSRMHHLSRSRGGRVLAVGMSVVLAATMADWVAAPPAAAAPQQSPVERASAEPQVLERPDETSALVTARLTGKKVRIAGMTSDTSEFWALPDGRVDAEVHLGPVRLRDEQSGGWKSVDFSLVPQADGSVAAKAHPADLRLSGSAGEGEHDLVSLTADGGRVSLGWSGRLPAPVVEGTKATYPEVRPGVDLVVESTRTGFEQFVVVKDRSAVAQVRDLSLPLRGRDGVTLVDDQRGGFEIRNRAGETVGVSPQPEMWDAQVDPQSGERVRRTTVAKKVEGAKAGRLAMTLTPDERWLTDPATVFPVTIDPATTLTPSYDAFVQSDYASDQSAATELKLGTFDKGATVARSFLRFNNLDFLQGKHVQAATLYLWEHYSWSCTPAQWETWETLYASTATRWTNQPEWRRGPLGYTTATKGYSSSCAAGWVNSSVTGAFADHATGATCCTVNIGIRATSETDNLGWKKFHSVENTNDPYVKLTYQSPPSVTSRATVPSTPCATNPNTPYINTKTPQLRAQITDPEGSQVKAEFEWLTGGGTRLGGAIVGPGASGSWLATVVPAGVFGEGGTYSWRVRGNDGSANGAWTGYCAVIIDTTAPSAMPTVSSTAYPTGLWAGAAGTAGSFTFGASGVADVAAYEYGLNVNPPNQTVNAPSLGANATVSITPTVDGPQTLYVRSRDRAGNTSATRTYTFNVGSGAVTAPKAGDITAAKTAITGVGQAAATGVTYQWRRGDADAWVNIPTGHVTVAAGGGTVTWPLPTSGGGVFPKLNWDVEATLAASDAESIPRSGPLQLRGVFAGGTGGTSSPVKITFDRDQASAASQEIGPGSVNLITGNYSLSDTDVSVSSYGSDLTVTRSYNTRRAGEADAANMFGPGWVSGAVVEEAESPYTSLTVYGSLVQVGMPEGDTIGFTKRTATAFDPEIGMEFLKLTYTSGSDSYTLTDEDGNTVVFKHLAGTAAGKYFPTSMTTPGNSQTTTLDWEKATIAGKEIVRPIRMLAPVADGVSCASLAKGCRALTFNYATATTATGTAEPAWGDYIGRVKEIAFTAWDPDLPTPAMRTVPMARYAYDNGGRLRAVWDPRLDWNDAGTTRQLRETYDYDNDGILTTVKPVAEEPWQLSYTTIPGDPGKGRLHKVTRSALTAGTAVNTVVYKVPTSGTGAPYDLSPSQTNRWAQPEAPTDATAVFPANQVPDGNPATGTLPSSYERATVTYMDANARQVNTAAPGGNISTTWYDQWGNTVRTLTAGNRARALDDSPTDDAVRESMLARSYSTLNIYSNDGQQLTRTLEPERDVMLPDGVVVRGRNTTINTYDEGPLSTGGPYNLITTQRVGVQINVNGVETDTDIRTTKTDYDRDLRQPTAVIVDPAGLAHTTRTTYDPITGLSTSTTTPAGGTSTTTPATRKTIYYRATSGSGYAECDLKPEWANLPCRIQPGGQAASGPELPATVTTYDMFNQPRVVTEKTSAGTLRTTTTTYDSASRAYETSVAVASGLGTAVPITRNVYDQATGRLLRTQSVTAGLVTSQVVKAYDTLGRQTSYTDADGVTSTTTYDLLGRVATSNDGKATRTYTYDGGSERRGLLTAVTDEQAGTFSGSYDTDGNLTSETWPNGVQVTTETDETGTQVGLTYAKPGCAADDCTLYRESVTESAHGQWRQRASTLSEQSYTYDQSGRLTSIRDVIGSQCTTRSYGFSTSSNRTNVAEYAPTEDGSCQTSTAASSRTWTYDTADRVNTAGYVYDALGRTTAVPAVDTANPSGGNATMTYHSTDLVDTITQGGRTTDYTLDVTGERIRSWTDNASGNVVESVNHYDGDDDSPSWTQETADQYTRPLSGLSGMAGIFDSDSGQVDWQVTNLHGDLIAAIHADDEGLSRTSEATEYGTLRNADDVGKQRYGWLGAKQRAADTPSGIILMGVRLYNTTTGRFLQVDPVDGGSCNAYDYTCADPANKFDVDGKKWCSDWRWICRKHKRVKRFAAKVNLGLRWEWKHGECRQMRCMPGSPHSNRRVNAGNKRYENWYCSRGSKTRFWIGAFGFVVGLSVAGVPIALHILMMEGKCAYR
ncbi:DNRLRE domain-containing protein [Micromonospora eburnea]|uniref:RHS repeat-associated core domain-containing protein n=1 Tax=Micromonospora eburnea TaxID=227316 RepID=A0A1C6VAD9_9ACTN|nr:DNRLRE domain-containing protein [Micromonospora eburnea]SCL63341.1 RHS repeat-associated core domain-containing protein [Micromonospora eburnea]